MNSEFKKLGKIADELVTYILQKNSRHVNFDISVSPKISKLVLRFDTCSETIEELLFETLSQERNIGMEEYAWELLGENDSSRELNLVGMCIDDVTVDHDGEETTITLYRYN